MIFDHLRTAIFDAGVQVALVSEAERQVILTRLRERLGVDISNNAPWDDDAAPVGHLRPDGWELIPGFVGDVGCLLILPGAHNLWKFRDGDDLLRVLKECPAFEFYVCDEDASYLVCSNHHDFIIGWGSALPWVAGLGAV